MKIAQISPLDESVPPKGYGGIERIVSYLTEELVRLGVDVTLFASGDSQTRATLVPVWNEATRSNGDQTDTIALHVAALEEALRHAEDTEVLHFHLDWLHFPAVRRQRLPTVTTLHNRIDRKELKPLFEEFRDIPLVSISNAQQRCAPELNWMDTVYHGLPLDRYQFHPNASDHLVFLGRINPDKGIEAAIEIARRSGKLLKVAAKVGDDQRDYFDATVQPAIDAGQVEFVGEVDEPQKDEFLGNATATLFPIQWPEPFGLVMIESLACGTPVIAFRRGAVPEVLEEGVSGFICEGVEEAVDRVHRIADLDRQTCREQFERRFSVRRMAEDYIKLYERLSSHC